MFIMGVQCAIFERESIQLTAWNGAIAGYLVGYTLTLFILYSLAPILFRLSSAMFYNLSLLTSGMSPLGRTNSDFWGLIIGIRLFGFYVYKLYPVAFVMVIIGMFH
jgi:solute carrier family 35 protein F1/2